MASASMFTGLSSLREAEKKPVEVSERAKALQAYLNSKYTGGGSNAAGDAEKKKKKKKKKEKLPAAGGVRIVDEDVSGFADVRANADDDDDEG